jgi:hypothetical protein
MLRCTGDGRDGSIASMRLSPGGVRFPSICCRIGTIGTPNGRKINDLLQNAYRRPDPRRFSKRDLAPGCLAANRPGFPVPIDREVCECHAAGGMEELRIDTQNGKHIYVRDAGGSVVAPSDPETVTSPFGSAAGLRRVARSFRRVLLQSLRATLVRCRPASTKPARRRHDEPRGDGSGTAARRIRR